MTAPRRTERVELVVHALREHRLATYRSNVLSLADRIGVDSAQHLRNLLEEQEARLRNAGPSIRDYEQASAILAALDVDEQAERATVADGWHRTAGRLGAEHAATAALREELEGAYALLAGIAKQAPDGKLRVTEETLANLDRRGTVRVYIDEATRDRIITAL